MFYLTDIRQKCYIIMRLSGCTEIMVKNGTSCPKEEKMAEMSQKKRHFANNFNDNKNETGI